MWLWVWVCSRVAVLVKCAFTRGHPYTIHEVSREHPYTIPVYGYHGVQVMMQGKRELTGATNIFKCHGAAILVKCAFYPPGPRLEYGWSTADLWLMDG